MGQMLSAPVTDKHTSSGENGRLKYGASAMQGWRVTMEDAHTTELEVAGHKDVAFFGVFDGHGGQTVAQYAGRNAHLRVVSDQEFTKGNYAAALKNAFLGLDEDLKRHPDHANDRSGCTAVALLVTPDNRLFCANAGDSRCVLSRGGLAIPLSFDHKPDNSEEEQRIVHAGGYIYGGRVNGNLALSRAIGDFAFKTNPTLPPEEQMVTALPDVIEEQITEEDEFAVLACDGIWDCMTNQQVVTFIRQRMGEGIPLGTICEQLMDHCISPNNDNVLGTGSDNMTAVIVGFTMGKGDEALRVKCSLPPTRPIPEEPEPASAARDENNGNGQGGGGRRIFFGTRSGVSMGGSGPNGTAAYSEEYEERGMVITEEGGGPNQPAAIRIPARRALELLLGLSLSRAEGGENGDVTGDDEAEDNGDAHMDDASAPEGGAERTSADGPDLR